MSSRAHLKPFRRTLRAGVRLALLLGLAGASESFADQLDPEALLRAADAPRQALREGSMRIRATVESSDQPPAISELEVHVKGSDRVLCVFRSGTQKDRRILVVGPRTWLLVPGTTHPIQVSANQRLLGAASITDLARLRFAEEFVGTIRGEETLDGVLHRVVDLKAKSRASTYQTGRLWVRADDGRASRVRLALRSGKEAKEIRFTAYGLDHGSTVLRRMEISHLLPAERGLRTVLDFLDYDPHPLSDALFEPASARVSP